MIKDENGDPSSPKKILNEKRRKRNRTHDDTLSSAYRVMLFHMEEEREK